MGGTVSEAVRELCLAFPEAQEVQSRGASDFRAGGKTFATYKVNHHGDGRVALWLNAPPGAQELYTQNEPEHYFVPPYVGPRGWLGVRVDGDLRWSTIAQRVREAYDNTAPPKLAQQLGATPCVPPPEKALPPEQLDPMARPRAQQMLGMLREFCLALPETSEGAQFGAPAFRAGKKTFALAHCSRGRTCVQFWVGAERQQALIHDPRYRIPRYVGRHGWIELDVEDFADRKEVDELAEPSYRHFALKRMLKAMDGGGNSHFGV